MRSVVRFRAHGGLYAVYLDYVDPTLQVPVHRVGYAQVGHHRRGRQASHRTRAGATPVSVE